MSQTVDTQVNILIATHNKVDMAAPEGYTLMQVNCANTGEHWDGYAHDDDGENISVKNPCYCELTALYSAWKNDTSDIKGLVHYRRFFSDNAQVQFNPRLLCDKNDLCESVLSADAIRQMDADVILVMPFAPYPLTARQELEKFCYKSDIAIMEDVIAESFPEYADALARVLDETNLSYFNMLIAKKDVFDDYCEWIFAVLGEIEKRCDIEDYDPQHKRLYGYLAEVLLNVYFESKNWKIQYMNMIIPYQFVGGTAEAYYQNVKRREQIQKLVNCRLLFLVNWYYRLRWPALYRCRYACLKRSLQRGSINNG